MGGHGGLNILPQKRWNVYGRENRLKVARDEEKYEAEQKELREKHEAAEREFRRKMLLERAQQRYGAMDTTEGPASQPGLLPAPYQAAEGVPSLEVDMEAFQRLTGGGAEGSSHAAAAGGEEQGQEEGPSRRDQKRERKRERRRERATEGGGGAAAGGGSARGPSLAKLAQQLDWGPTTGAAATAGSADAAAALAPGPIFEPERLQHVNLFADEEKKAKNPEAEAEKRDERRRRGNPETQTSDAKFDEKFKLGYGLTGKEAVPWYAKHAATLPGSAIEHMEAPSHHAAQLEQWRRAGKAALAAGAVGPPEEGTAGPRAPKVPQQGGGTQLLLLGGVRVAEGGAAAAAAAAGEREGQGKDKKKQKRRRSSSSSSSSSDSDSDSSGDRRRKRRRKKEERKGKKGRREGSGGRRSSKLQKQELLAQLRQERYEREEAERRRQEQLLRSHRAALMGGEPEGRRYHAGFGTKRRG